jgi:hypothetical protein
VGRLLVEWAALQGSMAMWPNRGQTLFSDPTKTFFCCLRRGKNRAGRSTQGFQLMVGPCRSQPPISSQMLACMARRKAVWALNWVLDPSLIEM